MKKLIFSILLISCILPAFSQFTNARLQATGLTCAMCSNAVNKALQKVSFVETVRSDIKNSAFTIKFREGAEVDIDALKIAVEDAGFSVGSLRLSGEFDKVKIGNDKHVKIGNQYFHFLNITTQELSGVKEITLVDKNFVTDKVFKKYSAATGKTCVTTGKAASCCEKEGIPHDTRIYHATI